MFGYFDTDIATAVIDIDVDVDVEVDIDIDVDIDEPVKEGQFLQSESHLLQPRSHVSEQKVSN